MQHGEPTKTYPENSTYTHNRCDTTTSAAGAAEQTSRVARPCLLRVATSQGENEKTVDGLTPRGRALLCQSDSVHWSVVRMDHQNQALACVTVPPARGHIVSFCPTSKKEKKDKKEKQYRRLGTLSPAMEGILVAIFSSHGGLGAKIFLSPGHQCPGDAGCRVSAHVHHCGLD